MTKKILIHSRPKNLALQGKDNQRPLSINFKQAPVLGAEKLILFLLFSVLCTIYSLTNTFADTVTITTYYPSPYGVYKILKINPSTTYTPAASCTGKEGEMYYDSGTKGLYLCTGIPLQWRPVSTGAGGVSYWKALGADIYNTNTAGNVGIGTGTTTSPNAKLDVRGGSALVEKLGIGMTTAPTQKLEIASGANGNLQMVGVNPPTTGWAANGGDINARRLCIEGICKDKTSFSGAPLNSYNIVCDVKILPGQGTAQNDCRATCYPGYALTSWACSGNYYNVCQIDTNNERKGYVFSGSPTPVPFSGSGTCTMASPALSSYTISCSVVRRGWGTSASQCSSTCYPGYSLSVSSWRCTGTYNECRVDPTNPRKGRVSSSVPNSAFSGSGTCNRL